MNLNHKNYGMNGSQNQIQDRDFYIEEIPSGRSLVFLDEFFLMTADVKKDGSRLCISMQTGNSRWFKSNLVVKTISLYHINNENNFLPIYENFTN